MLDQGRLEVARLEQLRECVPEEESDCGSLPPLQAQWLDPPPGRSVLRCEPPRRRKVGTCSERLRHHLVGDQQAELDPYAGDAVALPLARCRPVVIPRQCLPAHARAIVGDGERPAGGVSVHDDLTRARVEGVRDGGDPALRAQLPDLVLEAFPLPEQPRHLGRQVRPLALAG